MKKKDKEAIHDAAVAMGREGGKARAKRLSKRALRRIGRKAAATRWGNHKKRKSNEN